MKKITRKILREKNNFKENQHDLIKGVLSFNEAKKRGRDKINGTILFYDYLLQANLKTTWDNIFFLLQIDSHCYFFIKKNILMLTCY